MMRPDAPALFRDDRPLPVEASPGLWSALPAGDRTAPYDAIARLYDRVVGNPLYNRLIWGAWPAAYAHAARRVLAEAAPGPVLDCGCGSLVFTHRAYAEAQDRLVLMDRSLGMLARGRKRLSGGFFLQGDAFDPPFRDAPFAAVMSWGFLHLFGTASPLLDILARLAAPGGRVVLSTLVLSGRPLGDRMLRLLHRKGEAAAPQTAEEVTAAFSGRLRQVEWERQGNMLFLSGRALPRP